MNRRSGGLQTIVAGKLSQWLPDPALKATIDTVAKMFGTFQYAGFLLLLIYSAWLLNAPPVTQRLHLAAVKYNPKARFGGKIFTQNVCRWALGAFCDDKVLGPAASATPTPSGNN